MDWITDKIAIGNYLEAQDVSLLKQHGFRSILSLDGTLSEGHAADFGLVEISGYRFIDGAGNDGALFCRAIDDLRRMLTAS